MLPTKREILKAVILDSNLSRDIRESALDFYVNMPIMTVGRIAVDSESFDKIAEYAKIGKKIFAIKELRTASGCTLRDAKDAVETEFPSLVTKW